LSKAGQHVVLFEKERDLGGRQFFPPGRFGFMIMYTKSQSRDGWESIEDVPVSQWLVGRFGQRSYEVIHEPLVRLKFGPYAARLSAAWMWARIHRLGKSRTKITQQEKLGYIEGGTKILIDALERRFLQNGGRVFKGVTVQEIEVREAGVAGISYNGQRRAFDVVISTVPTPAFAAMLNGVSPDCLQEIARIDSIGVMCAASTEKASDVLFLDQYQ
jgi:protoporphyrinogen oxidase